jgi:hypothetical protein
LLKAIWKGEQAMQQALSGFGETGTLGPGPEDDDGDDDKDDDGKESPQSGEGSS